MRIIQMQNRGKILIKRRGRRKFTEGLTKAYSLAKAFILSGKTPNSDIINKLLGTFITEEELNMLLNSVKHLFKDLTNFQEVLASIRSLCKQNGTMCGVYI